MHEWTGTCWRIFPIVIAVARRGGFAAAASALNMSPSAVSHAVKAVEDRLGQPLFARTTRSVALTEAGADFVASIGPALAMVEESIEHIRAASGEVTGLLRINAPRLSLPLAITPAIVEMSRLHPGVTIEVTPDESLIDIVASGYDAGVRLGEMIAEDMVTVRLTPPFKTAMVASPKYLKKRPALLNIDDLAKHNCIGYRLLSSGAAYAWDLQVDGRQVAVNVAGSLRVSDPLYARELAREGVGIAYIFEPLVRDDLCARHLVEVLPETAIEEPGLFLYFPRHVAKAPKLRFFIEVVRRGRRAQRGAS